MPFQPIIILSLCFGLLFQLLFLHYYFIFKQRQKGRVFFALKSSHQTRRVSGNKNPAADTWAPGD